MSAQKALTDTEFHDELIERFFHPQSYFYRCIKHDILSLKRGGDANQEEYELFDRLLEKIVAATEKVALLETIGQIQGFDQFCERLRDGIDYLRENELDCDKMKIEIENLGQSLIKIAVKASFETTAKAQLDALLTDQNVSDFDLDSYPGAEEDEFEQFGDSPELSETLELNEPVELEYEEEEEPEDVGQQDATLQDEFDFMGKTGDLRRQSTTLEDQFDEIPLELIENLQSEEEQPTTETSAEPFSEDPDEHGPEIVAEGSQESLGISEDERDFLLVVDGGTDAAKKSGRDHEPTEAGGSVEVSRTRHAQRARISDEPLSLIDRFAFDIKTELGKLKAAIQALQRDETNAKHWKKSAAIFDKIAAQAMICGFEGFEEIGVKAKRFVSAVLNKIESVKDYQVDLLSETHRTLAILLQGEIDHADRHAIQKLSQKLEKPNSAQRKRRRRIEAPAPVESRDVNQEPITAQVPVQETPTPEELRIAEEPTLAPEASMEPVLQDPEPEVDVPAEPLVTAVDELKIDREQNDFDISNFSLPGEDDDEIMSLLNEISEGGEQIEESVDEAAELESAFEDPFESGLAEAFSVDEPVEADSLLSHVGVPDAPSPAQSETLAASQTVTARVTPDDKLAVFKEQSEFYFNIIQDALQKLQARPDDRIALEDLELSSHSLSELSQKLNLDEISTFPRGVEQLISSVIARGSGLTKNEFQIVTATYQYFLNLRRVEEVYSSKGKQLVARIERLTGKNATESNGSGDPTDFDSFQIV